jgi:hypothetical protein
MILPASYANGFAPRDGQPLYPELWRGSVGAWNPGLGPTGAILRDWSYGKHHASLVNTPVFSPSGGRFGLGFNGSNNYGQTTFVPDDGTSDMTFHCWCRYTAASQFAGLVYWRNGSYPFHLMAIGILLDSSGSPGAKLFCQDNNSDTSSRFAISTANYNDGLWHPVTAVRDAGAISLYIDGKLVAAATGAKPNIYHSSPVFIGSRSSSLTSVGTFSGDMDDVLIYRRAISPKHVARLASRRGIAYELAPRRRSSVAVAGGGFKAAWIPRRSLVIGGGTN